MKPEKGSGWRLIEPHWNIPASSQEQWSVTIGSGSQHLIQIMNETVNLWGSMLRTGWGWLTCAESTCS